VAVVLIPLLVSLAILLTPGSASSGLSIWAFAAIGVLMVLPLYLAVMWFVHRRRPANEYLSRHWLAGAAAGLGIGVGVLQFEWRDSLEGGVGKAAARRLALAKADTSWSAFLDTETAAKTLPWVYVCAALGLVCLAIWCVCPAWNRRRLKGLVPVEGTIVRLNLGISGFRGIGPSGRPVTSAQVTVDWEGEELRQRVKLYGMDTDINDYLTEGEPVTLWLDPATKELTVRTAAQDRLMGLEPTERSGLAKLEAEIAELRAAGELDELAEGDLAADYPEATDDIGHDLNEVAEP
jgi:hypothetical protein